MAFCETFRQRQNLIIVADFAATTVAQSTKNAATIKTLERLEATRAFDRRLISEEDDRAIIERVVTGAKLLAAS